MRLGRWVGMSAALLTLGSSPEPAGEYREGKVGSCEGAVEVWREGGRSWEPLQRKMEIFPEDRLRTGGKGRVRILLDDDSIVDVGPESDLIWGDSRLNLSTYPSLYLRRGVVWVDEERGEALPIKFTVGTPVTLVHDRGTKFVVAVASDGATLVGVDEGRLWVLTANGRTTLRTGSQIFVQNLNQAPRQTDYNPRRAFWEQWPAEHLADPALTLTETAVALAEAAAAEKQNARSSLDNSAQRLDESRSVAAKLETPPPGQDNVAAVYANEMADKLDRGYDSLMSWQWADARARLIPESLEELNALGLARPERVGGDPDRLRQAVAAALAAAPSPAEHAAQLAQAREQREQMWQWVERFRFNRKYHQREFLVPRRPTPALPAPE